MRPISVVVNARLQSSRTKSKMIRPYGDSCLLDIALEKLDQMDFFTHRFLAVAEKELKDKLKKYKHIELIERRSESVAPGPHHPMITFEHYTRMPTKYIFVMNSCAAFLSVSTIKKAFDYFQATNYRSYIAVMKNRDWLFTSRGEALTHKNPDALQNTSDGEFYYKATHAFYIADRDYFIENNGKLWTLTVDDPHLIEMPVEEAFDVDTDLDFEISSFLYNKKISSGL